ncbi:ATP-binding protein [Trichloromonas sp.]|uniref:ATP-binding protein n=1 Tax=Trichloromonas sp. TaxID=3069249 RepID=UPI003D812C68
MWFSVWMAVALVLFGAGAAAAEQKRVLILHSYDPGYPWTAGLMAGVEEVLGRSGENIRLHVEYMDTKRYHSEEYLDRILEVVLPYKLAGLSFHLVLVSDNDAFSFALKHRRDLFRGVPIVFCGLNNYQPAMISGLDGITGIAEVTSVRGTLQVALELHPETEEVIVIGNTLELTGRLTKERILSYLPEFENRVRFSFWDNLEVEELTARLAGLTSGQIVLLSSIVTYERGVVPLLSESVSRIRQASPVPLYSLWESDLGQGVVGGKLISAHQQGALAGQLVLRVLRGEPAEAIPVISNDANQYLFDYNELKRFGVDFSRLPAGSSLINQPTSFYAISKELFWLAAALGLAALVIMALLLLTLRSRKKNEAVLREHSWLLQTLIDAIPLPIYYKDVEGRYAGCNAAGEKFIGQTRQAIIGKTVHDLFPAVQALRYQDSDQALLQRGGVQVFEGLMTVADGRTCDVLFHKAAYCRSDGSFAGVVGSILDITGRKEAERRLTQALAEAREAREKIETIIRSMAEGLIVTDLNRRVLLINPQAETMLGIKGRPVGDPIDIPALKGHFDAVRAGNHEFFFDEIGLPDEFRDRISTLQARSSLLLGKDGENTGVITILRDVTRERAFDRMKDEFISTAAHELRTPLTSVLGFSEILLHQEQYGITDPKLQLELLGHISEKAEHLARIVDDLLDLGRIQAGRKIPLEKSLCKIRSLVEKVVTPYRNMAAGYDFEICLPPEPEEICVDPKKMVQVFENLVSNAVKYSPEGGVIRIAGDLSEGRYQLSVADPGIGMTPEQCGRIFESFFRVDASNTAVEGLGLGMTITKNIIEAHGGDIWLESEKGKGTTVFFVLPLEVFCDRSLLSRGHEETGGAQ